MKRSNHKGLTMADIGAMASRRTKKELSGFGKAVEILKNKYKKG